MTKATWNGEVIARSERTERVEGNHYFPPNSVNDECLVKSETKSVCPWKGPAHDYHVRVNGELNADAAWYYPNPKAEAANIKDHIAFWKGVVVDD